MSSVTLKADVPEFIIQDKTLLSQIRFSLHAHELLVIIGRNGAGKSTLLKHITTEIHNPKAYVEVFGQDIRKYTNRQLAQRRAVLPQSTALSFAYDVLDVVLLGRIPHQQRQNETLGDIEIATKCLSEVGLSGYENRSYLTLSGGEQQRVHFARVLAQLHGVSDDRLLILDEPTSSLDISHQHQALQLVKTMTQDNLSCIAVLHDLNLAAQYADKVLILNQGKMVAFGSPKEVLTSEILTSAFNYKIQTVKHPSLDCPLIISC